MKVWVSHVYHPSWGSWRFLRWRFSCAQRIWNKIRRDCDNLDRTITSRMERKIRLGYWKTDQTSYWTVWYWKELQNTKENKNFNERLPCLLFIKIIPTKGSITWCFLVTIKLIEEASNRSLYFLFYFQSFFVFSSSAFISGERYDQTRLPTYRTTRVWTRRTTRAYCRDFL